MDKLLLGLAIAALSGCSANDGRSVTEAEFIQQGKRWPLTVSSVRVGCTGEARWVEISGTRYGLNGLAGATQGYADIEPFWRVDEEQRAEMLKAFTAKEVDAAPVMRINIGDLSEEASRECAR